MKKKVFIISLICSLTAFAGWWISENQDVELSDLNTENIDAFAAVNPLCPNGCLTSGGWCWCYGMHQYNEKDDW